MKSSCQPAPSTYLPSPPRMLPFLLLTSSYALVFLLIAAFWPDRPVITVVLSVVILVPIGCQLALVCVAMLYRMAHAYPAIMVCDEGLVDNASLLYRGVGLIRWSEIAAIVAQDYRTDMFYGIWRRRFLAIVPVNWPEYERHLPLGIRLQRLLLRLMLRSPGACICIPQFMLPTTADEVAEQLRMDAHYTGLYAPSRG
jgi:hypothetical protein